MSSPKTTLFMSDLQYRDILHSTKNERVRMARESLAEVFGKSNVRVHAGSVIKGLEDTTNWLYITIYLRKNDERLKKKYPDFRKEIIEILLKGNVTLFKTAYCSGVEDEYALVIDTYEKKNKPREI